MKNFFEKVLIYFVFQKINKIILNVKDVNIHDLVDFRE